MKRLLIVTLAVTLCAFTSSVWAAGPYPDNLQDDTYGVLQGGAVNGIPTPNANNDPGPDIYSAINLLLGTFYSTNQEADSHQWTYLDHTWTDLSDEDFEGTYIFIGLSALNSNTLSVYEADAAGNMIAAPIPVLGPYTGFGYVAGTGTAADPFDASFSPYTAGTNFGFMLTTVEPGGGTEDWYSNPALNGDVMDHMITYHLPELQDQTVWIEYECVTDPSGICTEEYTFFDPYLIGFEDIECTINGQGRIVCGDEDYDDTLFLVDRVRPVPEPISLILLGSGLLGLAGLRRKRS